MKKKGFTLIELLAVIAILGIIITIAVVSINATREAAFNKIDEASTNNLKNIGELYYSDHNRKDEYVEYLDNKNNYISCIKITTLIEDGYIKDNEYEKEIIDNYLIKITKNGKNVTSKLIKKEEASECYYYQADEESADINVAIGNNNVEEVGDYNLVETITSTGEKNVFNVTMSFKTKVYKKIEVEKRKKMHVLVMLDESGSMSGTRFSNAKAAAISMSESLISSNPNAMMGLIEFESSARWMFYGNRAFTSSDFAFGGGGTDASSAMILAYNKFKEIDNSKDDQIFFAILLSDGGSSNTTSIVNYANLMKEMGVYLVTIGYDLYSGYSYYTDIPSSFCGADGNQKCYFTAGTADIGKLFTDLAVTIDEVTSKSSISNVKMEVNVSDYLTVLGTNIEEHNKNSLSEYIEVGDASSEELIVTKTFRVKLNTDKLLDSCKEEVCTVTIPINDLKLYLTDYSDNVTTSSFDDASIPTLTITFKKDSVLN